MESLALRHVFRKFKRAASRLRDGIAAFEDEATIQFSMRIEVGKVPTSAFNEDQQLIRFAVLLRPFLDAASPVELSAVWSQLTSIPDLLSAELRQQVLDAFATAERLDCGVILDGRQLTSGDVYRAYAEGEFFGADDEARRVVAQLSTGPGVSFASFLFYSACLNYTRAVFVLLETILQVERERPALSDAARAETPRCIHCLREDGAFESEEHVIPESFGMDDMLLFDAVCDRCNNELSALDQFLAEFDPLAFLRVIHVPFTKAGKLPRANLRDFVVEKVKPRVLRFTSKNGKQIFREQPLKDGQVHLSTMITSRKAVDMLRIARAIFKIALGVVAFDAGSEFACDMRFNDARAFIRGTGTMPNHMLMSRQSVPAPVIQTAWHPETPTVVVIDLFGVAFAVNLEPLPFNLPADLPAETGYAFWLGECTRKGIIVPCGVGCAHAETNAVR